MATRLTPEEVLTQLRLNAEDIARHKASLEVLYNRRQDLFWEGRSLDPPMNYRLMGVAANIKDSGVHGDLSKRARRRFAAVNR